ncbi:hypothetical protein BH09PLA1_BH09PLA1_09540 [soil metagenome]
MHIAFVSTYDARDPSLWAGTTFHMWRALEAQGIKIEHINPLREHGRLGLRIVQELYARIGRRAFHRDREAIVINGYAKQIAAALKRSSAEIVFCAGSIAISQLNTDRPIVFWTDATYQSMLDSYKWELPVSKRSHRLGNMQEKSALSRAALAIYSSDWAAKYAIEHLGTDPAKVKVVPFGANISESRTLDDAKRLIDRRVRDRQQGDMCRLLFIGTGWQRKGGDVAVDVARRLNERGVKTELTVLGSDAPGDLPAFVKVVGFLDKRTPQGRQQFDELFGSSHFLMLPARAEAYGIVLCEACSFAVSCVASRVGGISTIVQEGVNGALFAPDDSIAIADRIESLTRDQKAYDRLAVSAFCEYKARLNWESAARTVKSLLLPLR